ncbi:MAG: nucleoside-diphosphate sugar epimerase/dehydratase, partial [Acidimicrobiales bacterium]
MDWAKRSSVVLQLVLDAAVWAIAVPAAIIARFNLDPRFIPDVRWLRFTIIAVAVNVGSGLLNGLYRRRWRYSSFEEATAAIRAAVLTTVLLAAANRYILVPRYVPVSVPITAGFMAIVAIGGARYVYRLLGDRSHRPEGESVRRALVFGAGEGATQTITAMLRDKAGTYLPVGLLDDDPAKRRLTIRGVKVLGGRGAVQAAAAATQADTLLIAIPSASGSLVAELTALGREAGLACKVLPSINEIVHGARVGEIRDVTEADLLGRHQVSTDVSSAAGYLKGKRVLITGAGGSIGSELCRQVNAFEPAAMLMLDRDESALHSVQLSLEGRALLDSPYVLLADLRDEATIRRLFEDHRPEVVFHAGALKHLPLLERYPSEAVQSNVWGTLTVLEAAAAVGVERFINISTDKAADPENVLGYTKCIGEMLTAGAGQDADGAWVSVRFGNVLGSRGSVLTTFQHQLDAGKPLTVTHEDVTRYFMTVEEAVQLVIQAGAIGENGDVLVLEMGEPVRIADVARRMAETVDPPVGVDFTGLRPGEKLTETLFATHEVPEPTRHEAISRVRSGVLPPE